jgi:hypothetical protein
VRGISPNGLPFSPYLFPIYFIAFWCAINFVISFLGGWFTLSLRFRRLSEPYGDTRSAGPLFYSVRMRFTMRYSSVVRLETDREALYLSVIFPFRVGHPPLRIPWEEIQTGKSSLLWYRFVVLTLGNEERIPMRISERMARNLGILDRFPVAAQQ